MKDVAPFLGVMTPDRRRALRAAWSPLPRSTADDVAAVSRALWALPEREYQYAACDLIARHVTEAPGGVRRRPRAGPADDRRRGGTPWTPSGSAAITPLVARHPADVELMWTWLDSGDRWLIRAAIQHQRGLKEDTDLDRLFTMCDRFADDREFFIAKAIGWALRDVTAWDPAAVQSFVDGHPDLSPVARREATKGLSRSARP